MPTTGVCVCVLLVCWGGGGDSGVYMCPTGIIVDHTHARTCSRDIGEDSKAGLITVANVLG